MSVYMRQVGTIVWKDLLLELRTRERIAAMAAFAVLAGVLFNFSTDTSVVRPQDVAAGLIWMTLVFDGLLGVGRTFHLETEDGALQGILMSPAPKDAIFLGKTISNFALLYVVALLVLGVFMLFFGLRIGSSPWALLLALALGSLGFVALGTLFAAVSSGNQYMGTGASRMMLPLPAVRGSSDPAKASPVVRYRRSAASTASAAARLPRSRGPARAPGRWCRSACRVAA